MDPLQQKVPQHNAQSLFFPYDEQENRYRSSFYEENMTCHQISKQDMKTFFDGLNHFSSDFAEAKKFPSFVTHMLLGGLASLLAGIMIVFYGRYYIYSQVVSIIGLLFIVAGFYLGFKAVNKFIENSEEISQQTRDDIMGYMNDSSKPFKSKNLNWKMPEEHCDWIELTLAPNAKSKSLFSEKDTRITLGDISARDGSMMDYKQSVSKPFLSQI